EGDDEVIVLSNVDNSNLISRLQLSLVGRMFHKDGRSIEALVALLPKENIWDVEGRVRGVTLENSRFQFDFDSETDLQKVLRRRLCHFNKWSFSLERWKPHVGNEFPNSMTFWIRTEGIPRHFWVEELLTEFGGTFGVVRDVDTSTGRIQLTVRADEPLKFKRKVQLPSGEVVMVYLCYEKLHRWCSVCSRICHEKEHCPLLPESQRLDTSLVPHSALEVAAQSYDVQGRNGRSHPSWWQGSPTRYPAKGRSNETSHQNRLKVNKAVNFTSKGKGIQSDRDGKEKAWRRSDSSKAKALSQRHDSHPHGSSRFETASHPRKTPRGESGIIIKENPLHSSKPIKNSQMPKNRQVDVTRLKDSVKDRSPFPLSDSQMTISDPHIGNAKAKQVYVSPSFTHERPFRLNLQKKSGPLAKGNEKEGENTGGGESSDTGSSAKKRLLFEVPPMPLSVPNQTAAKLLSQPPSSSTPVLNKSWYDITVEEEEQEAAIVRSEVKDPLDQIRIDNPRTSHVGKLDDSTNPGALAPSIETELNDLTLGDAEENNMEWDNQAVEEADGDLDWTAEDEAAFQESDPVFDEAAENYGIANMLDEELYD
ncbi:unnamed protein product, partial [Arabidopsis halleri]